MTTPSPQPSARSAASPRPRRLRPAGGYRATASFQTATCLFSEKFLDPRSRLADQMVQAARSGRQFWGCTACPDCKGAAEL